MFFHNNYICSKFVCKDNSFDKRHEQGHNKQLAALEMQELFQYFIGKIISKALKNFSWCEL